MPDQISRTPPKFRRIVTTHGADGKPMILIDGDAIMQREICHGTIHCAGVEIQVRKSFGESFRARTLT